MLNIHTYYEILKFHYDCFAEIAETVGGCQTGTIEVHGSVATTTRLPLGTMWLGFRKIEGKNNSQYYILLAQHAEDIFISLEDDGAKEWVEEHKFD